MTLTDLELSRTLDIEFYILLNRYSKDVVAVQISSYIWNYLHLLGIGGRRTVVHKVKEQIHTKFITEGMKRNVNISFIRSAYVSGTENPTAQHFTSENEIRVLENRKPDICTDYLLQKPFMGREVLDFRHCCLRLEEICEMERRTKNMICESTRISVDEAEPMMWPSHSLWTTHDEEYCSIWTIHIDEQYVFVRYYDVIEDEEVPGDGLDEKRKCILLKWELHGKDKEWREKAKYLRFVR